MYNFDNFWTGLSLSPEVYVYAFAVIFLIVSLNSIASLKPFVVWFADFVSVSIVDNILLYLV